MAHPIEVANLYDRLEPIQPHIGVFTPDYLRELYDDGSLTDEDLKLGRDEYQDPFEYLAYLLVCEREARDYDEQDAQDHALEYACDAMEAL